jgi:hypothetical protein
MAATARVQRSVERVMGVTSLSVCGAREHPPVFAYGFDGLRGSSTGAGLQRPLDSEA